MKKKIAVIGSGMSGLAAAWYLGQDNEITLFEKHSKVGIGAHSVDLEGGRIDVPLRVIYPGYYPELFRLLAECGVGVEPLDASLSFSEPGGRCYFRYRNFRVFGGTIPFASPAMLLEPMARQILFDLARFLRSVPKEYARGQLEGLTIGDYLRDRNYSPAFIDQFLIPCFSGINTVSNESVGNYPAEHIAQYFTRGFVFSSVYRAVGGASAILDALSRRVTKTELGARIDAVRRCPSGVSVQTASNGEQIFDAVVFATQANQVLTMLVDASIEERAVLESFRYGSVKVLMHRDVNLAPHDRKTWAPVNYLLSDRHDRPMITIWANALLPSYSSDVPMFQTINPYIEADERLVVQQSDLERPIVDLDTNRWIQQLDALNKEEDRRIFFCGSYAATGIPLLESATASALNVARNIAAQGILTAACRGGATGRSALLMSPVVDLRSAPPP